MESKGESEELTTLFNKFHVDEEDDAPKLEPKEAEWLVQYLQQLKCGDESELVKVLEFIGDLARTEPPRMVLGEVGSLIETLSPFIHSSQEEVQRLTARAIGNLCFDHASNRKAFYEKGKLLEPLVQMLSSANPQVQRNAAGALANLASDNAQIQKDIGELGGVELLVKLLSSEHLFCQAMAARALCNLSELGENVPKLIDSKGVEGFFSLIESDSELLQNELSTIIWNLSGNDKGKVALIEKDAVGLLLRQILGKTNVEDEDLEESALETFAHLVEQDEFKTLCIEKGHYKSLLAIMRQTLEGKPVAIQHHLLKTLATISMDDATLPVFFEYFDRFFKLSSTSDLTLLVSSLLILGNLARTDGNCKKMIETNGFLDHLLELGKHEDIRVGHLALGAVRNLSVPAQNKQILMKNGIIPYVIQLISKEENPNAHIQFVCIGIMRSLLAAGGDIIDQVLKAGGLEPLLKLAKGEMRDKDMIRNEKEEGREPDKRVEYESSRILSRLSEKVDAATVIATNGGIDPFILLVESKFDILQAEGLKGLCNLVDIGGAKEEVKAKNISDKFNGLATSTDPVVQELCKSLISKMS